MLSKMEVIRQLGENIIAFLAQLENFQKKLWLKKKFVTETNYCITLDRLADHTDLLELVFDNENQLADWEKLYALDLDKLDHDYEALSWEVFLAKPAYRYLMLDTRHFDEAFKAQLLATIEDLDDQCDGLLVHSENFQALNLLQERYKEQVKCIYIDPPYNTGGDGFIYRDQYQHSSWASALYDRIFISSKLMNTENSSCFVSIDDVERSMLENVGEQVFGSGSFISACIWHKIYAPKSSAKQFSEDHDYVMVFSPQKENWSPSLLPRTEEQNSVYKNPDNDPRGPWRPNNLAARNQYSKGIYSITCPGGRVIPGPPSGSYWRVSEEKFWNLDSDNRIWWGEDGNNVPAPKIFLSEVKDGRVPQTIWNYKDVGHTQEGKKIIISLFKTDNPDEVFSTPKPPRLIERVSRIGLGTKGIVLDYFAGSGTTGHAVINLNREDNGQRKYILVEMGDYFDTVLKPRIQKVVYADTWKAGSPVADKDGNLNGVSHCFKTIRLESYEDALGNLALNRQKGQQQLLEASENSDLNTARQSYVMNYMLEVETRGSASLLNSKLFVDPTAYQLNVRSASGDETKAVNIDLLETFNYLLGLTVEHIAAPVYFDAELTQGEFGRWQATVKRVTDASKGKWWFRTVYGTNRNGQSVLVVWRNLPSVIQKDDKGLLKDNAVLDAVLIEKLNIRLTASQDDEIDILYVNGDHNINIPKNRKGELMEQARIQLIEEAFHRLMFAGTESDLPGKV